MAIYVPPSRRRRQLILVGVVALVVGAAVGAFVGRSTAPSISDKVRSSQQRASELAAGLRVIAIHQEADTASLQASADAGADLTLRRTESALKDAVSGAPWISPSTKSNLLAMVAQLRSGAAGKASTPEFAERVESVATAIESAFGVGGQGGPQG
jgi:hypothetical protein